MTIARQRVYALAIVERMVVVKSQYLNPHESQSFDLLLELMDELWQFLRNKDDLASDEYEQFRQRIDAARPSRESFATTEFSLRNVYWMLKSALMVFRGREHAFEIGRQGFEMATRAQLDEQCEDSNQLSIVQKLQSLSDLGPEPIEQLREFIRELPIKSGIPRRFEW